MENITGGKSREDGTKRESIEEGRKRASLSRRSGVATGALWLLLLALTAGALGLLGAAGQAGAADGVRLAADARGAAAAWNGPAAPFAGQALAAPAGAADAGAAAEAAARALPASLAKLAELGRRSAAPGMPLRLVVKWQGEYDGPAGDKAAAALAAAMDLRLRSQGEEEGRRTLRYAGEAGGARVSLFWSELAGGRHYAIVTLETGDLANASGLTAAAADAGAAMIASGVRAEWNASVQGEARTQGTPREALIAAESGLAKLLPGAAELESYEDVSTLSRSYGVAGLGRTVPGKAGDIGLQIAVHRVSEGGRDRITIGCPLITIEY